VWRKNKQNRFYSFIRVTFSRTKDVELVYSHLATIITTPKPHQHKSLEVRMHSHPKAHAYFRYIV